MPTFSFVRRATLRLAAACAAAALAPASASAQSIFFDWNGGSRQVVPMSPTMQPGQIIVSFADRRLYHVVGRGQAVSYPIAVPREQSRWEGTTSVSMKKA